MFTIYKKNPEILVGNFRSVRTVRFVYHLPKISGLSRRARLDSSYHMKLHSERPNRENETTFSEFPFVPGIFQWDKPKKTFTMYIPIEIFREFVVNGKQPRSTVVVSLAKSFLLIIFYHSDRLETQNPPLNCKCLLLRPVKRFPFRLKEQLPVFLPSKSHEPPADLLASAKKATWN